MFDLINVNKKFVTDKNIIRAVDDVNLRIYEKEVFGIIGSSGAGKSTLIRCLNLLEYPESGEIIFKGKDLLKLSKKEIRETRKKIGMVFQNFNLLNSRTVFENIAFPIKHLSKEEINTKVRDLLEIVDLSDKINSYPNQLSGGQKQRVAIARAIANDPDVLLCDEATSALDPQTTASILALLKDLNETLDLTIILITHEMSVIKSICDRVAIMSDGEIVEVNDVLKIFTNPKHSITKSFISDSYNFDNIKETIKRGDSSKFENSQVFELVYGENTSNKSIISDLVVDFDLNVNIIAGSIEVVSKQSIGRLVVIVKGSSASLNAGLKYLESEGVIVNEIND